jgi:hypothetical protein
MCHVLKELGFGVEENRENFYAEVWSKKRGATGSLASIIYWVSVEKLDEIIKDSYRTQAT